MTSERGFHHNNFKKIIMNATATNLQKLSDKVYQILANRGFSKLFNWEDYRYFKKQSQDKQNPAEYIAEQFIFWNTHEESDFADYEF